MGSSWTCAEHGRRVRSAFKRAVEQGRQRVGVSRESAIHAVAEARREGATGYHVAGSTSTQRCARAARPTTARGLRDGLRFESAACARIISAGNDAVARCQSAAARAESSEELPASEQFRDQANDEAGKGVAKAQADTGTGAPCPRGRFGLHCARAGVDRARNGGYGMNARLLANVLRPRPEPKPARGVRAVDARPL